VLGFVEVTVGRSVALYSPTHSTIHGQLNIRLSSMGRGDLNGAADENGLDTITRHEFVDGRDWRCSCRRHEQAGPTINESANDHGHIEN
jgi:hypothetical protein